MKSQGTKTVIIHRFVNGKSVGATELTNRFVYQTRHGYWINWGNHRRERVKQSEIYPNIYHFDIYDWKDNDDEI